MSFEISNVCIPIDPTRPEFLDRPLWCVYGEQCFPSMICCKVIHDDRYGPTIWGYSVYRNSPGFRTLGRNLKTWVKQNKAIFFADQMMALQFMANITLPAAGAL